MVEKSTSSLSREMERKAKQATVEDIRQDREGKPEDVEHLLELIESHLFEATPDVRASRQSATQAAETAWRFRSCLGSDPLTYLDRRRLETASRLLKSTRATVADIATSLGFEDASLFTKWFKRRRGQTPLEVRGDGGKTGARGSEATRRLEVGRLLDSAAAGTSTPNLVIEVPCVGRLALVGALPPDDTKLVLYFVKWRNGAEGTP